MSKSIQTPSPLLVFVGMLVYEKLPFIFIFISFLYSHIKSTIIWNFFLVVPNVFFFFFFFFFFLTQNADCIYFGRSNEYSQFKL